jgi:hypothetical protein
MHIVSTKPIGSKPRLSNITHHTRTQQNANTLSAEVPGAKKGTRSNDSSSRANSRLALGEAVRHGRHGNGQVVAHWPNGTVLVRFDGAPKSLLVWPSFLDRVCGQRR